MDKCEKCGFPLQVSMLSIFNSSKALDGKELVCTNPNCTIGRKNSPPQDMREIE
jgi:hypothetical protein